MTCRCKAYEFPHRFTGGKCTPLRWVKQYFIRNTSYDLTCLRCNCLDGDNCSVYDGLESPKYCEALADFLNYNEINVKWK